MYALINSCRASNHFAIITIIITIINCNWVVTRWQWLFYMYTKYGKDGKTDLVNVPILRQNVFSFNLLVPELIFFLF